MKIVTSEQMKAIEAKAMEKLSISSIVLMENAAIGATKHCLSYLKNFSEPKAIVFCGKGNNGGDGFAIARQLFNQKISVKIVLFGDIKKATTDCFSNYTIAKNMGISTISFKQENIELISSLIKEADLCVDALIGTGLKKALYPELDLLVDLINKKSKYTIAVDIPTGVNSDNGSVPSKAIKANETIAFHLSKVGHFLSEGSLLCGSVHIEQIGINYSEDCLCSPCYNILTLNAAKKLLPERKLNSNKGSFGKAFIITGSSNMTGAGFFNCSSAYNAGSGIVKLFSVKECCDVVKVLLPEALTYSLKGENGYLSPTDFDEIKEELNKGSVIAIGSGLGKNTYTKDFLSSLLQNAKKPLLLDADALNIISENKELLSLIKTDCVITPHIREMSTLTGLDKAYIANNITDVALDFSKKYGVITVLKDYRTIIADKNGNAFINTTGSPAMAKGGSGDCLVGTISAFIAQGLSSFEAAVLGCYVNGLAGEIAEEKLGSFSVKARDIIDNIGLAIKKISSI